MPARAELDAVTLVRGGRPVLQDVTLSVPATGVTALVGPSGAGKSSLLRLLVRLEDADAGVVRVDGRPVGEHDPQALRRHLGLVAQTPVMLEGSVAANLTYGVAAEAVDIRGVLARAGLGPEFAERSATELSGGEAMRVAIARALARGPAALLLDEPTAALDAGTRDGLAASLAGLAREGMTIVIVTHDDALARRLGDHAVRVVAGRVVAAGPAGAVLA